MVGKPLKKKIISMNFCWTFLDNKKVPPSKLGMTNATSIGPDVIPQPTGSPSNPAGGPKQSKKESYI